MVKSISIYFYWLSNQKSHRVMQSVTNSTLKIKQKQVKTSRTIYPMHFMRIQLIPCLLYTTLTWEIDTEDFSRMQENKNTFKK